MVGDNQGNPLAVVYPTSQPANRLLALQQSLNGKTPHGQNNAWLEEFNLPDEEGLTLSQFFGFWIAITGRAAFDGMGDINLRGP